MWLPPQLNDNEEEYESAAEIDWLRELLQCRALRFIETVL